MPSPSQTQSLISLFKSFAPIAEEDLQEILSSAEERTFKRGETFAQFGEPTKNVGFVEKGLFRAFCLSSEGQIYIRNFCSSGYFVGAFASLIRRVPSDVTIEAIEDSKVIFTEYAKLEALFERSMAWQKFGRKLAENHYVERETKEYRLLSCTALERYDFFLQENAHLLGRVSQADIASFIGVTPVSLSRALGARRK